MIDLKKFKPGMTAEEAVTVAGSGLMSVESEDDSGDEETYADPDQVIKELKDSVESLRQEVAQLNGSLYKLQKENSALGMRVSRYENYGSKSVEDELDAINGILDEFKARQAVTSYNRDYFLSVPMLIDDKVKIAQALKRQVYQFYKTDTSDISFILLLADRDQDTINDIWTGLTSFETKQYDDDAENYELIGA
jgi:hypothetical protein